MPAKKRVQIVENCQYAVELGKRLNFSLVCTDGNDIMSGNKVLTLGLGNSPYLVTLLRSRRVSTDETHGGIGGPFLGFTV